MTKKQEKIKEAYGQYWDLVNDQIDENGWLDQKGIHKPLPGLTMDVLNPYDPKYCYYMRPVSLAGLDDNNGWISIESEADFPKNKLDHSFVYSLKENMISSIQLNIVRNDQIEELFEDDWITHYQPIIKPKPPIY